MRIHLLAFTTLVAACSSDHDEACTAVGCVTASSSVRLPIAASSDTGEMTGCIDDVCAVVTFSSKDSGSTHIEVGGWGAVLSVTRDGTNVNAQFALDWRAPRDGAVFRATLRDGSSGTTKAVKSDPVHWNLAYPNGSSCPPVCATANNLAVHPA